MSLGEEINLCLSLYLGTEDVLLLLNKADYLLYRPI